MKVNLMEIFWKIFIYLFINRGKGKERNISVVASCLPPTKDLACNPGMCPDWESNWWSSGLKASAQSPEPRQPGLMEVFI